MLPTKIVITSYIHDKETYLRHVKWLKYVRKNIKDKLGISEIIFLDNNSDLKFLRKLKATIYSENGDLLSQQPSDLKIIRFEEHLPRKSLLDYPYHWRAFFHIPKLESAKYIWIDTDCYIQNNKPIDYINNCNSGLVAFYDDYHKFPETALMIINPDAINIIKDFSKFGYNNLAGKLAETITPFTHVEKNVSCSRIAEYNKPYNHLDVACQVKLKQKVDFFDK